MASNNIQSSLSQEIFPTTPSDWENSQQVPETVSAGVTVDHSANTSIPGTVSSEDVSGDTNSTTGESVPSHASLGDSGNMAQVCIVHLFAYNCSCPIDF
jgi:hypothetical protein